MSPPVETGKSRITIAAPKKAPGSVVSRREPRGRKAPVPPPNLFAKALDIGPEEAIEIFRRMLRIRQLKAPAWIGCEAGLAAIGSVLTPDDVIHSAHAEQGSASDIELVAAARGVVKLTHAPELSGTALAGVRFIEGSIALSAGAALACRLQRKRQIAVSLLDGGVSSSGAFFETLQLALSWELPLLLVAFHPPPDSRTATQGRTWVSRAESFGLGATRCDGLCALEVRDHTRNAANHVRAHKGPFLLEVTIPESARQMGLDIDSARRDPVALFRQRLIEAGAMSEETAAQFESGHATTNVFTTERTESLQRRSGSQQQTEAARGTQQGV